MAFTSPSRLPYTRSQARPLLSARRPNAPRARRRQPTCALDAKKRDTASWATKYKAYVKRNGEMLCAMAWEGYERLGRGAVFANYDDNAASVAVLRPGSREMESARPSFYVDRAQLVKRGGDVEQMKPILQRIARYDPRSQFVVVFEADGTQGADIVTPNMLPAEVWTRSMMGGKKEGEET